MMRGCVRWWARERSVDKLLSMSYLVACAWQKKGLIVYIAATFKGLGRTTSGFGWRWLARVWQHVYTYNVSILASPGVLVQLPVHLRASKHLTRAKPAD